MNHWNLWSEVEADMMVWRMMQGVQYEVEANMDCGIRSHFEYLSLSLSLSTYFASSEKYDWGH